MTMLLHDAGTQGLFDILGQAFFAVDTLNTARETTIPAELLDVVTQTELITGATGEPSVLNALAAIAGLGGAQSAWQSSGGTLTAALRAAAQNLLVAFCQADNPALGTSLVDNMTYLVDQMTAGTVTGGDHVDAPVLTIDSTTGASSTNNTALVTLSYGTNIGNVCICATLTRGDGQTQQNALVETISAAVQTAGVAPTISLATDPAVTDRLSHLWPGGSGINTAFVACNTANSLLTNGSFETAAVTNQPDNWIIAVGTPGTSLILTAPCQQSVTIAGTPTGGTYVLKWTDGYGTVRATAPLPYNATTGQVQTALQAIAGLEQVTVATTGTTPNYAHTVTFMGVGGAVAALTYISQLTGGSPTITINATVVASDPNTLAGNALTIVGDGAQLTDLYHVLPSLRSDTTYFLGLRIRAKTSDVVAAGEMKIEIMDGIGGSVTADSASTNNVATINLTTIANDKWTFQALDFRIAPETIQPVYLRIRLSTAITSGKTVYLDEIGIVQGTEVYTGGPIVAAFSGSKAARAGDVWAIQVTNDRSGLFQEWFNRFFGMADMGLLLPVAGVGAEIDDALIA
jgi:hypothetical protein